MLYLIINAHCSKNFSISKYHQLFCTIVDLPLKDSDPYDYLQFKFIKGILGINYKSTYAAFRVELNRLPIKAKTNPLH